MMGIAALNPSYKAGLLVLLVASVVTLLVMHGPIPQAASYNVFSDQRAWLGIPHALNVLSNLPFLLVGIWGLWRLPRFTFATRTEYWLWGGFFLGVGLTALGSAYYHWQPDNLRLIWDRLPITFAFLFLFAAVLAERVSVRLAVWSLWPILAYGAASVIYWYLSETWGQGDLRAYILVQLLPLLLIPLLMLLYPPRYNKSGSLLLATGWYALAKLFEALDGWVYQLSGVVSGHTLKHLLAVMATAQIAWMLNRREMYRTA